MEENNPKAAGGNGMEIRDERTVADDSLQDESILRVLAQVAFEGIAIHDHEKILEVNDRLAGMFGYERSELIGKSVLDLAAPEFREIVRHNIQSGNEQAYNGRGLCKDGTTFLGELRGKCFSYKGRMVQATAIQDITEKKRAEKALQESEERYRVFVQQSSEGIWRIQMEKPMPVQLPVEEQIEHLHRYSYVAECNDVMAKMVGFSHSKELLGQRVRDLRASPIQNRDLQRTFILSGYRLEDAESQGSDPSGGQRFFLNNSMGIVENGYLVGIWGVQRNITDRKKTEEAVRASEQRYRLLFERNLAGVFSSTLDGHILDCNESFARILGYSRSELLSATSWNLYPARALRLELIQRLREQNPLTNVDVCLKNRDGSLLWGLANVSLIEDSQGGSVLEGTLVDITDRKKAEEQVAYQAHHDVLTGLPNRSLFHDRLAQALSLAERSKQGLALMFLDLDHFKLINDSLGHSVGDWLLKEIGERIKGAIRSVDTVARLGGDEFILLLPETDRSEDVVRVAQKLLDVIKSPLQHVNHELYITTSAGISLYPGDGRDVETLIRSADNALYRAKEMGRNTFQFWSPDLQMRAEERLSLERSLRRAVEKSEFLLFYQPQFDVQSRRVTGVEALMRWQHPEKGLVLPGGFIQVIEETRLIVSLTQWLLQTSCRQVKRWQDQGFADLRLSVNLSAHQFQQQNLVEILDGVLEETGLPSSSLVVEITETVTMSDVEFTLAQLRTLRGKGVRIALDDFGMGYSSLSYLKHFPIDIIKIDTSFVRDIGKGSQEEALIRAVIHLGHSLNRSIIAEGVETELQYAFLKDHRCEEIQGNLLCPAVDSDQIVKVLQSGPTNLSLP